MRENLTNNFATSRWEAGYSLIGKNIDLVPLGICHHDGLVEAVKDGEIYNLWYTFVPSPKTMQKEINRRLNLCAQKQMMPFTVMDKQGKILGMTTYEVLDFTNRRVVIGYTWYCKSAQRTFVNTEAKLLLLTNAFENMQVIAVGFYTSYFNFPSRKAIERIGAKLDGILRNHKILEDGTIRDSCYYSIIESEWNIVKKNLKYLLEQYK